MSQINFDKELLKLGTAMLDDARSSGLLHTKKGTIPNVPELFPQIIPLCDAILYGKKKIDEKEGIDIKVTTMKAELDSLIAGMGVAELWINNREELENKTLVQAVIEPRGADGIIDNFDKLLGISKEGEEKESYEELFHKFDAQIIAVRDEYNPENLNYNFSSKDFGETLEIVALTRLFRESLGALFFLGMTYRFEELESIEIAKCDDDAKIEAIKDKYKVLMIDVDIPIKEIEEEEKKRAEEAKREEEKKKAEEAKKRAEEEKIRQAKRKKKRIITLSIVGAVVAIIVGLIVGTSISNKVNSSPDKLVISGEKAVLCVKNSDLTLSMDIEFSNTGNKSITELWGNFELLDENNSVIDEMESYMANGLQSINIGPYETQKITVDMFLDNAINYEKLLKSTNPEDINVVFTIETLRFNPGTVKTKINDKREIKFSQFDNQYKKQLENKMIELKNNLPQMLEENGWIDKSWFDSSFKWDIQQTGDNTFLCKYGNSDNKILELICTYDSNRNFVDVTVQLDEREKYLAQNKTIK